MLYKVYVLFSMVHNKLFVGMTSSLSDRMIEHNSDNPEDWTSAFRPWILIHIELFEYEEDAFIRAAFLEGSVGQNYIQNEILPIFNF